MGRGARDGDVGERRRAARGGGRGFGGSCVLERPRSWKLACSAPVLGARCRRGARRPASRRPHAARIASRRGTRPFARKRDPARREGAARRREVAARTNVSRETSARTPCSGHRCVRNRFEVTKITAVKLFVCIGALSCDENGPRVFRDLVFRCRGIPSRRPSASAGLHAGDFCDSAAVFRDERLACGPPRRPPVEHAPHHLVTWATCNRHAWRTGARYDRFNNN